jgi:transposase InsO family protein
MARFDSTSRKAQTSDGTRVTSLVASLVRSTPGRARPSAGKLLLKHSTGSSAMGIRTMLRPLESAQYAASADSSQLAELGATASMSRKGCCYDNAPMESLFHTLKFELVRQRGCNTHNDARRGVIRPPISKAITTVSGSIPLSGNVTPEQAEPMAA